MSPTFSSFLSSLSTDLVTAAIGVLAQEIEEALESGQTQDIPEKMQDLLVLSSMTRPTHRGLWNDLADRIDRRDSSLGLDVYLHALPSPLPAPSERTLVARFKPCAHRVYAQDAEPTFSKLRAALADKTNLLPERRAVIADILCEGAFLKASQMPSKGGKIELLPPYASLESCRSAMLEILDTPDLPQDTYDFARMNYLGHLRFLFATQSEQAFRLTLSHFAAAKEDPAKGALTQGLANLILDFAQSPRLAGEDPKTRAANRSRLYAAKKEALPFAHDEDDRLDSKAAAVASLLTEASFVATYNKDLAFEGFCTAGRALTPNDARAASYGSLFTHFLDVKTAADPQQKPKILAALCQTAVQGSFFANVVMHEMLVTAERIKATQPFVARDLIETLLEKASRADLSALQKKGWNTPLCFLQINKACAAQNIGKTLAELTAAIDKARQPAKMSLAGSESCVVLLALAPDAVCVAPAAIFRGLRATLRLFGLSRGLGEEAAKSLLSTGATARHADARLEATHALETLCSVAKGTSLGYENQAQAALRRLGYYKLKQRVTRGWRTINHAFAVPTV